MKDPRRAGRGVAATPEEPRRSRAMNPECRPISFTTPTPLGHDAASTFAAAINGIAASTAEWNPKLKSISGMSLSMVFGTTATAHLVPRRAISSSIFEAPFIVPSPPAR